MKKIFTAGFLLVAFFFLTGCTPKTADKNQSLAPRELSPEPTKSLEATIMERPFVTLEPTTDGHWVNLEVSNLKSDLKSVDYELIYFAGDIGNKIERGVAGSVELKGDRSFSRKILFGSESCTVKCKYKFDENVSEGVLTLKLRGDGGVEKFESSFRLQKGTEAKEGLTTGDGNFKIQADNLLATSYFLTISPIGIPGELTGTIAAIPYAVFPSVTMKGTVSFKTSLTNAKVLFWQGTKWQNLETAFVDGWLTASATKTGTYVLVKE